MATTQTRKQTLDTALWAAQWSLALTFQLSGMLKLFVPAADLARLPGAIALGVPAAMLHTVGALELSAALALILPAVTRIAPGLSTAAAIALAVSALLGAGSPETAGAFTSMPVDLVLAAMALGVAYGRALKAPIAPLAVEIDAAEEADRAAAELVAAQLARARARHQPAIAGRFGKAIRPISLDNEGRPALPAAVGQRRPSLRNIKRLPSAQLFVGTGAPRA